MKKKEEEIIIVGRGRKKTASTEWQKKDESGSIMQNVYDYILCSVIAGRPNSVSLPRD